MKYECGMHLGFGVNVQPKILKDGRIIREYPMMHNLVLDTGLEMLATNSAAEVFEWARVGIGTTPTQRSSGATTVSVSGATATASAPLFEPADASNDRAMLFSTGEVVKITGYTDNQNVTVSPSGTIASATVIIYNVEQTALANGVVSSNTYRNTGNAENGSNLGTGSILIEKQSTGAACSMSGLTLTWPSGNFEVGDVGKMVVRSTSTFIPNNGLHSRITAFISPTQVTLAESLTSGVFNIHVGSYQKLQRWRTFEFPAEVIQVTYTEAGWSHADPANPTDLFGRVLFIEQGSNVTVEIGEQLLLYVEMNTYIDSTVLNITGIPITNITSNATSAYHPLDLSTASSILSSGNSSSLASNVAFCTEPNQNLSYILLSNSTASVYFTGFEVTATNTFWIICTVGVGGPAYVAGSYEKYISGLFTGVSGDLVGDWTMINLMNTNTLDDYRNSWRWVFDTPQTKTTSQTVRLVFKKSWGRFLA